MRQVVMVSAYFNNPTMLQKQLAALDQLPEKFVRLFSLVVVDDCSEPFPADDSAVHPFDFQIYRLTTKVRWNQDTCRNLGVASSDSPWLFLTDMDHIPTPEAIRWMIEGAGVHRNRVYRFSRVSAPEMQPYKPHPNTWFMHRELYDQVGGYDERLAGVYGTDMDFKKRLDDVAVTELRPELVVRVPRTVVPDASTPLDYGRKSDAEKVEMSRRISEREKKVSAGAPRTLRGSFPWVRVR